MSLNEFMIGIIYKRAVVSYPNQALNSYTGEYLHLGKHNKYFRLMKSIYCVLQNVNISWSMS